MPKFVSLSEENKAKLDKAIQKEKLVLKFIIPTFCIVYPIAILGIIWYVGFEALKAEIGEQTLYLGILGFGILEVIAAYTVNRAIKNSIAAKENITEKEVLITTYEGTKLKGFGKDAEVTYLFDVIDEPGRRITLNKQHLPAIGFDKGQKVEIHMDVKSDFLFSAQPFEQ